MENKNTDLKIKKLHKAFGKNKVLNGIDFELVEGERVVILGPSGSGKSTFLRCINAAYKTLSENDAQSGATPQAKPNNNK